MAEFGQQLKAVIGFSTKGVKEANADIDSVNQNLNALGKAAPSGNNTGSQWFKKIQKDAKQTGDAFNLTRQEMLTLNYTVGDVVASLASGTSPFTILLQQAGQVRDGFGGFGNALSKVGVIALRLSPILLGLAGALTAVKFLSLGQDAADAALELDKFTRQAGITLESMQALRDIGEQKGVGIEAIAGGFERLRKFALEATDATQKLVRQIDKARDLQTGRILDPELAKKSQELYNSSIEDSGDVLKQLSRDLAGVGGSVKGTESLIRRLVITIKTLPAGLVGQLQLEKLKDQFGSEFIRLLQQSGDEILAIGTGIGAAAGQFDRATVQLAEKNQALVAKIAQASRDAKQAINNLFLPATVARNDWLLKWVTDAEGGFARLRRALEPAAATLRDFFLILSGDQKAADSSPITAGIVKGVGVAVDAIKFLANTITTAFKGVYNDVDAVTKALGGLVGINLEAWVVIATAAVTALAFGFRGLLIPLATTIGVFALAAIGVDSIGVAFDILVRRISARGQFIKGWFNYNLLIPIAKGVELFRKLLGKISSTPELENSADQALEELRQKSDEIGKALPDWEKEGNAAGDKYGKGFWFELSQELKNRRGELLDEITGASKQFSESFMKGAEKGPNDTKKAVDGLKQSVEATGIAGKNASEAMWIGHRKVSEEIAKSKAAQESLNSSQNTGAAGTTKIVSIIKGASRQWIEVADSAAKAKTAVDGVNQASSTINIIKGSTVTRGVEVAREKTEELGRSIDTVTRKGKINIIEETPLQLKRLEDLKAGVDKVDESAKRAESSVRDIPTAPTSPANVAASSVNSEAAQAAAANNTKQALDQKNEALRQTVQLNEQAKATAPAPAAAPEIETNANATITSIQNLGQQALEAVGATITNVGVTVNSALQDITGRVNEAIAAIERLARSVQSIPNIPFTGGGGGGSEVITAASGGYIRGPGSGTSDSILARVSNGEYVVNAEAVRKWGVGFFHSLNAMKSAQLQFGLPKFAEGGLVAPAGAFGGSNTQTSGRSLTLVLDGRSYGPLSGPARVISALETEAGLRQRASASKRPQGWKG